MKQNIASRRITVAVVTAGLMFGCLLPTPRFASAQTSTGDSADDSAKRAVMKIEESTHKLTPENQEAKQVIVSKIYDTQDPLGNSYLLRVSGNAKAIVIDPGYNYEAIAKYLDQLKVDLEAILLTNGGFLRIAGNEELQKRWPQATILVGEKDAGLLTDTKANMSSEFGGVTSPIANVWVKDGDMFEIAGIPVSVVGTPGFTPGSVTYVLPTDDTTIAFTGDFIYKDGISNGGMPSSSEDELQKSLDHFLETQYAGTLVFPGNGANTSVSEFYQQMTGKSVSVIDGDKTNDSDSPIIIVERDPATVVVTEPVYVPTVEYRTETIVVERDVRPWLAVGVSIPLWSNWYRPWDDYYHYHGPVLPPIYYYRSHRGWSGYHGGYYPPPLIVPSRPGRPVFPPGFVPPPDRWPDRRGVGPYIPGAWPGRPGSDRPGPDRPGPDRPETRPDRPGGRPFTPGAWPDRPGSDRPGFRPGRPGQGPDITPPRPDQVRPNRPDTRPSPGLTPGTRPVPGTRPNDRPVPGMPSGNRPTPGTRPSDRPVPGMPSGNRPVPGTRSSSDSRMTPAVPSARPSITPSTRPASPSAVRPGTRPGSDARPTPPSPATRPTPAPSTRPTPSTRPASPPSVRPNPGMTPATRPGGDARSSRPSSGRSSPTASSPRPASPPSARSTPPSSARSNMGASPGMSPGSRSGGSRSGDSMASSGSRSGGGSRGGSFASQGGGRSARGADSDGK